MKIYKKVRYIPSSVSGYQLGSHLCIRLFYIYIWTDYILLYSVQFSSVAQSCPTLCDSMKHSTPGLPVHHQLPDPSKPMSLELVMPSNHLILCHPLLLPPSIFPSIRIFSNELTLCIRWPKYWSFSFSIILSKNTQGWSPLGWTGWISLQSKGLSRVFSNTTVQSINSLVLSFFYSPTLTSVHDYWENQSFD